MATMAATTSEAECGSLALVNRGGQQARSDAGPAAEKSGSPGPQRDADSAAVHKFAQRLAAALSAYGSNTVGTERLVIKVAHALGVHAEGAPCACRVARYARRRWCCGVVDK